jgi:hypothetical protein
MLTESTIRKLFDRLFVLLNVWNLEFRVIHTCSSNSCEVLSDTLFISCSRRGTNSDGHSASELGIIITVWRHFLLHFF